MQVSKAPIYKWLCHTQVATKVNVTSPSTFSPHRTMYFMMLRLDSLDVHCRSLMKRDVYSCIVMDTPPRKAGRRGGFTRTDKQATARVLYRPSGSPGNWGSDQ